MNLVDRQSAGGFVGKPVDLHPVATCQSPHLSGDFTGDKFTITVGPIKRVFDFSASHN